MKLITWNVQWCCGVDGKVDPARIVTEAKRQADFDVLCLQEIGDNYPHPRLAGSAGEDQFAMLSALLPGYVAVPGVAVSPDGSQVYFLTSTGAESSDQASATSLSSVSINGGQPAVIRRGCS